MKQRPTGRPEPNEEMKGGVHSPRTQRSRRAHPQPPRQGVVVQNYFEGSGGSVGSGQLMPTDAPVLG